MKQRHDSDAARATALALGKTTGFSSMLTIGVLYRGREIDASFWIEVLHFTQVFIIIKSSSMAPWPQPTAKFLHPKTPSSSSSSSCPPSIAPDQENKKDGK
jgi:hypothetical protein